MSAVAETLAAPRAVGILARLPNWRWAALLRGGSLAAAVVALLVGAALGEPQAIVTAGLGLALGLGIIRLGFRGQERAFLTTLFLVAWALRVVGAVGSHELLLRMGRGGFLLMDDRAYDKLGWALVKVWTGQYPGILKTDEYLMVNYTYLLAIIYFFLGHSLLAAKMLNVMLGALTAVLVYVLGRELFDRRTAVIAALFTAFFPSMALWSTVNLKDPMVVALTVAAIFGLLRFARRHEWWALALSLASFYYLENLRPYVFLILAWLLPVGFLLADRSPLRRKLIRFAPVLIGVALISVVTNNEEFGLKWLSPKALTDAEWARYVGARGADSGIDEMALKPPKEMETITRRTLDYLPRGLYYVVLGPVPWESRAGMARAVIPEMLVWYLIVTAALVGLVVSFRRRWRELMLPLGLSAGVVLALALTAGNTGNLFRHRSMYLPYTFILAAVGLQWVWMKWEARRAARVADGVG